MKRFLFILLLPFLMNSNVYAATGAGFTDTRVQTACTIVVATSTTVSSECDLGGTMIVGIQTPATFTGTAITFQAATASGGTYNAVKDGAGSSVSVTVANGQYIAIDPTKLKGIRFIKLVSGSVEGADRILTIFSVPAR